MALVRNAGFDAGRIFSLLRINAGALLPVSARERELLRFSGLGWTASQYSAFQLCAALVAGLACAVAFTFANLFFGASEWLVLVSFPCALAGLLIARIHVRASAVGRDRSVDANLSGALLELECELRCGRSLLPALSGACKGGYGGFSELACEALALVREGESVELAFREAARGTGSRAFRAFAEMVGEAHRSGADLRASVAGFRQQLGDSRKATFAEHSDECGRISTLAVVLTGVMPGLLVFALAESGFVLGVVLPVELFVVFFAIVFPLAKYALQARLAFSGQGF